MDSVEAAAIAWGIIILIYAIDFGIRLFLLFYIPKNRKPTAAAAWLLAIYVVPLWGTLAFLLIGSTKLSKRRRR
ncbi:cardiolipin synthase A, partial [Candidatus Saccharibacteria bacterium]|nr:cardiolipin synthase A [Candidatus Saccharibacteria bacterium]